MTSYAESRRELHDERAHAGGLTTMPELFVMRHAKSDWNSGAASDFDRPLNQRGRDDAQRMAQWLDDQDLVPDHIVSSSAARARDTAGAVAAHFSMEDELELRDDLYLASSQQWFDTLRGQTWSSLLICGHNPGIDDLVDLLGNGSAALTDDGKLMTTAAVAHFDLEVDWDSIGFGTGRLLTLVRPREV